MKVLASLFLVTATAAFAQTPPQPPPAAPRAVPAQPSYQIGAQDELKISVFDADELNGTYRVDSDGFITFPLLGRVHLGGSTLAEAQETLKGLLAKDYIRNPQVRVDINEYKSQSIIVSGEVRAPAE